MDRRDAKNAAEFAYANAIVEIQSGNIREAQKHWNQSLDFYHKIDVETIDDAASINTVINGISIPSYMHEDVVKTRVRDYLISKYNEKIVRHYPELFERK